MSASLKGRSVIVTGGSKGIGKGMARVFASHGAKVLIVARHFEGCGGCRAGIAQRRRNRRRICG